jgi:hypothetical protein
VGTKPNPLDGMKLGAMKFMAEQQQKGMQILTYLLEAQKEVLEFEVGVLDDVLRIVKKGAAPRQV